MRSTKSPSWTSGALLRLLGFGPLQVPAQVFGIDARHLRFARFARDGAALRVLEAHEVELAADAFQSGPLGGPLRSPDAFGELLRAVLERCSTPVREASLVLPDAWLRVLFTESEALPSGEEAREEVLRWKLRRLVPYRVDELRVAGLETAPLPGQPEGSWLALGFAVEALLQQLETVFASRGVHLGAISPRSLALLAGLQPAEGLTALVVVDAESYALVFGRGAAAGGEPVLHRYKAWSAALPLAARRAQVARELRLTRTFLAERFGARDFASVLLLAPPDLAPAWRDWLEEGLAQPPRLLGGEALRLADPLAPEPLLALGPLAGAACQEVE